MIVMNTHLPASANNLNSVMVNAKNTQNNKGITSVKYPSPTSFWYESEVAEPVVLIIAI